MHTENYHYHHDKATLNGFLAHNQNTSEKQPGVLVFPDWSGCNDFAKAQAKSLANMGYVGFAADIYGSGAVGETNEAKEALMTPFMNNRAYLLARIQAAFEALTALPSVDATRTAAIGFCFGGLCALDLARANHTLSAAVSFHGLLHRNTANPIHPIQTKLLVLHGYDDPMVPPEQVQAFCDEMTHAKADWQVHMYGQTSHAFTNPDANDTALGTMYHPQSARRAQLSMQQFLADNLKPTP